MLPCRRTLSAFVVLLPASLGACEEEAPARKEPPVAPAGKVEIVKVEAGANVADRIQKEVARAASDHKSLVVYVGAPWCEPCVRFHDAAQAGKLDTVFPNLRLLEFDHDQHEVGLRQAQCTSRLIPLFARPDDAGRCSERRIEGSIKGEGAVDEIVPRLKGLL
ncbi:MAG: thioredoxin [Polyangiaceae bacterium]